MTTENDFGKLGSSENKILLILLKLFSKHDAIIIFFIVVIAVVDPIFNYCKYITKQL